MSPRFAICDGLSRCAWQGFRWQQALHKVHLQQYVPALDPDEDSIWVGGLRARFAFYNLNLASVERCSHD